MKLDKLALAAAALLIVSTQAHAAVINVGGQCLIFRAIVSANTMPFLRDTVCQAMGQIRSIYGLIGYLAWLNQIAYFPPTFQRQMVRRFSSFYLPANCYT